MENTERTIENLLGLKAKVYRITKSQVKALANVLLQEAVTNTRKGVSNVDGCQDHIIKGDTQLQHGAFKGFFEDGTPRREYARKILKLLQ